LYLNQLQAPKAYLITNNQGYKSAKPLPNLAEKKEKNKDKEL
jgi:hypothetical protein